MTSSLVGSEMCIRDRPAEVLPRVSSHDGTSPPTYTTDAVSVPSTVSADTVSYTHLTLPTICSV
eukprot:7300555-Prorocentrum_lima.AAC.1